MPAMHLLIKPVSSQCNLRCAYCFYLDTAKNRLTQSYGIMALETLEQVLQKALQTAEGACTIAYQGGEPTLAGLDFFKASIALQNKYNTKGLKLHNAIQTNGVLLDKQWAEFLRDNNFLTGVSLDGPKDCHDPFRQAINGQGSWKNAMQGITYLKQAGAPYNILTVVNAITAKKIQSIYNFFQKNQFAYLQFIPCLQPLGQEAAPQPFTLSPKAWGGFLCTLFDLWYRDYIKGNAPHIRQFENYIEMLLGYPPESCGMGGQCAMQHVIEADGSCYPCDFYVLDNYNLGNLNQVGFEEINQKRQELQFIQESVNIHKACKKCKYLRLCRGGCKRYCQPLLGGRRQNLLCAGYEQFFAHSGQRLMELARRLS